MAGRQLQRPPLVRFRFGLDICLRPSGFPVTRDTLSSPSSASEVALGLGPSPFPLFRGVPHSASLTSLPLLKREPPTLGYTASTGPKRQQDFNLLVYRTARHTRQDPEGISPRGLALSKNRRNQRIEFWLLV